MVSIVRAGRVVVPTDLRDRLGLTPGALATALWHFRQEYPRPPRRLVRATLGPDDDVDAEVRDLIRAVV